MPKCKIAGSAAPQCGHVCIITIAALGCGAPMRNGEIHIGRNTGIPAKSVNYFYRNMKDAKFHYKCANEGGFYGLNRLFGNQNDHNKYLGLLQFMAGLARSDLPTETHGAKIDLDLLDKPQTPR